MTEQITDILNQAAGEGRNSLLENEVYAVLQRLGCAVPRHIFVPTGQSLPSQYPQALGLDPSGGDSRVVIKVVSPLIAHKTDVGGISIVSAHAQSVSDELDRMREEVPKRFAKDLEANPHHRPQELANLEGPALEVAIREQIGGFLVVELMAVEEEGPGSEILFGLRYNREFGPVLSMGLGGVDTELFGAACRKGLALVSASPLLLTDDELLQLFKSTLAYRRLAGLTRKGKVLASDAAILKVIEAFAMAARLMGQDGTQEGEGKGKSRPCWTLTELEVNPFAVVNGQLCALDGLLQFKPRTDLPVPRPIESLGPMLNPKSVAVVGVSSKGMNMGRIILRNIIDAGFDKDRMYIIRPNEESIDGVQCVPSVGDLPERVDLFVVAVSADQVPDIVEELAQTDKAVGVILIPGGMGEKAGGNTIEDRVRSALVNAHKEGKPIVANGGNCLGIVSRPGRYHTLFVPQSKLPLREDGKGNVALISQSGAYMITRMSKLAWLSPRYAVSTGNQVDLTISDFMHHLAKDPHVHTFGVYVEGFKDGDGLEFAKVVKEITDSGRDVIFYKAGRTAEGKTATSGHTASMAGDYHVCESIVEKAGAHVADKFELFLDLLKVSSLMGSRKWKGPRLAALSNAGYEAVGIADNLRGEGWSLELATLTDQTRQELQQTLAKGHIDSLVDVRNPLDLTPMADDRAHEEAVEAFMGDPGVDMVLCATIPLTPTMATLAEGVAPEWSIYSDKSLVTRLKRSLQNSDKPLVACIDSGLLYDPMTRALEEIGIPTFRTCDQAVRTLGLYLRGKGQA